MVESQLAPLLDEETKAALVEAPPVHVRVADLGEGYRVEVGQESRALDDPGRDCVERARVASVFIAMNLGTQPAAKKRVAEPEPEPEPEPVTVPEEPPAPLEVLAGIEFAGAPIARTTSFGVRAGLGLRAGSWLYCFSTGIQAPAALERVSESASGVVDLIRAPTELGLTWLLGSRRLEYGPHAALAMDVLVFRGRNLPADVTAVRLSPGAVAGLMMRSRVSRDFKIFLSASASGYPAEYRFRSEPAGISEHGPRFWLGVDLGIVRGVNPGD